MPPTAPGPGILALDFGGTKLSAALTGGEAPVHWQALLRARSEAEARVNLQTMLDLAYRLLEGRHPAAIGVSFGGPVNFVAGRVICSHHVSGWEDVPLRDLLQSEFDAPVVVENDGNIAALGEWRFGAGQGCDSLLYVTVSTGVGGGWVLNGHIFRGADGLAGEIGHTVIQPDGPVCTCGKRGCVESLASGPYLARQARERLSQSPHSGRQLREMAHQEVATITAETVAQAAEAGDELARQVLGTAANALGRGIGAALALLNPRRVVVGGGVSKSGAFYWRCLRETVQGHVLPGVTVDILPAALGDDAPLWGAVALAEAELISSVDSDTKG